MHSRVFSSRQSEIQVPGSRYEFCGWEGGRGGGGRIRGRVRAGK